MDRLPHGTITCCLSLLALAAGGCGENLNAIYLYNNTGASYTVMINDQLVCRDGRLAPHRSKALSLSQLDRLALTGDGGAWHYTFLIPPPSYYGTYNRTYATYQLQPDRRIYLVDPLAKMPAPVPPGGVEGILLEPEPPHP